MAKWIEDWFGSPYYSMLYKHRDCDEAELFIDNLVTFLNIPPKSRILDCGCGKGRHSTYLSKKGFKVTGVDISESNITESKKYENDNLSFYVHDLRNLFRTNYYDVALSLFTSFGYSDNDSENNKIIRTISVSLKKGGWFILDFMNVEKEIKKLTPEEKVEIEGIRFNIKRASKNNCIIKEISISDKNKCYSFKENVKAYKRKDLENFFTSNGFEVVHLLGDYELNPFNEQTSERLILIGRKNNT